MSFCPVCGTQRVSRFCSQCGHDFGLENLSDQVEFAEETSEALEASVDDSIASGALEPEVKTSSDEVEDAKAPDVTEFAQENAGSGEFDLASSEADSTAEAEDPHIEMEAASPEVESIADPESQGQTPSDLISSGADESEESVLEKVVPPSVALPIAGWYLDPKNPSRLRFWDGTTWTDRLGEYLIPQGKPAEPQKGKTSALGGKKTQDKKCGFCQYPASEGSVACRACGERL